MGVVPRAMCTWPRVGGARDYQVGVAEQTLLRVKKPDQDPTEDRRPAVFTFVLEALDRDLEHAGSDCNGVVPLEPAFGHPTYGVLALGQTGLIGLVADAASTVNRSEWLNRSAGTPKTEFRRPALEVGAYAAVAEAGRLGEQFIDPALLHVLPEGHGQLTPHIGSCLHSLRRLKPLQNVGYVADLDRASVQVLPRPITLAN